ncbi:hypothetical protein WJX74_006814 [Apatococcus lobatus]|uniref:Uncharacterized protein n=1 Tax=Apatococcus lobatus TaxID=904363 RepID=A0AAW1Q212_9CHLO
MAPTLETLDKEILIVLDTFSSLVRAARITLDDQDISQKPQDKRSAGELVGAVAEHRGSQLQQNTHNMREGLKQMQQEMSASLQMAWI